MWRWGRLRTWINCDDGKVYRVGNRNLSLLEILGYLLCAISLVIYVLHDKAGFNAAWIGWVLFGAGITMAILGNPHEDDQDT